MRNKKSHQLIDRIVGFFKSNSRQILEIVILLVAFALPNCLNFSRIIIEMIEKPESLDDSIIYHLAVKYGNGLIAVLFALLVLIKLRKSNKDCLMNTVKSYHDYSYGWYWFCAKILGIKQCNLAYVPIHMQFKLVINGVFDKYPYDENAYPIIPNEPDCLVTMFNKDKSDEEINIVLEDTYPMDNGQIPKNKRLLKTIKISRNNGEVISHHYSPKFVDSVNNTIRSMNRIQIVNIFATTNPINTLRIIENTFAQGRRGNIEHLFVFQQKRRGKRAFYSKGYKIY